MVVVYVLACAYMHDTFEVVGYLYIRLIQFSRVHWQEKSLCSLHGLMYTLHKV